MAPHHPKLTLPDFVRGSDLLEGALLFAQGAYREEGRRGQAKLRHSVEVASLLNQAGFDEEVIAAGLLHDVVESTGSDLSQVAERFGSGIAALVETMTEDERISSYEARKAEHRARVTARGFRPAAIYAADKLAKMPHLRADADSASEKQLAHYQQTLEALRAGHPSLPFLSDLERELEAVAVQRRDRINDRGEAAPAQ
ncbi:MAG: HD domain-containing protein [Actinomycetota bacterium]